MIWIGSQRLSTCTNAPGDFVWYLLCCIPYLFGSDSGLSPSYSLFIPFKIELSCVMTTDKISTTKNHTLRIAIFWHEHIWQIQFGFFFTIFQIQSCAFFSPVNKIKFHDLCQCQCQWMNEWLRYGSVNGIPSPAIDGFHFFSSLWLAYGSCRPHH